LCSLALPQEDAASIRAITKLHEWFYDSMSSTQIIFLPLKMETVYIKTPLGIAAITGDVNGVSEITV
jgi:hypothetical protein